MVQKLYCYVDETGQDTHGAFFLVAMILKEDERLVLLERQLLAIESSIRGRLLRWSKLAFEAKMALLHQLAELEGLRGAIYYSNYQNSTAYTPLTALSIAKAVLTKAAQDYAVTVIIDGLNDKERQVISHELRKLQVRHRKIRGMKDEQSVFLRLVHVFAGFLASLITRKELDGGMETLPQTKSELIDQLNQSWAVLEQTLARLSDEQMTAPRDQVGWSIKDHLDHLSVWEEGIAALLEHQPRLAAMGLDATDEKDLHDETKFDEQNAKIRERTRTRTLPETHAALRASRQHLLRALGALTDADLQRGYSYYQPDAPGEDSGRPVVNWIVGNSSGHYLEHLPWMQAIVSPSRANKSKEG